MKKLILLLIFPILLQAGSFAIGNSTSDYESIISKSANYTIVETVDSLIVLVTSGSSANVTITMPAASAYEGKKIKIVKQDSGTKFVAIARAGSDTIRGSATSLYLVQQGDSAEFTPSSVDWVLLGDPYRSLQAAVNFSGSTPSLGTIGATWVNSSITDGGVGIITLSPLTGAFLSDVTWEGISTNGSPTIVSGNGAASASSIPILIYTTNTGAVVDVNIRITATGRR